MFGLREFCEVDIVAFAERVLCVFDHSRWGQKSHLGNVEAIFWRSREDLGAIWVHPGAVLCYDGVILGDILGNRGPPRSSFCEVEIADVTCVLISGFEYSRWGQKSHLGNVWAREDLGPTWVHCGAILFYVGTIFGPPWRTWGLLGSTLVFIRFARWTLLILTIYMFLCAWIKTFDLWVVVFKKCCYLGCSKRSQARA